MLSVLRFAIGQSVQDALWGIGRLSVCHAQRVSTSLDLCGLQAGAPRPSAWCEGFDHGHLWPCSVTTTAPLKASNNRFVFERHIDPLPLVCVDLQSHGLVH